MSQFLQTFRKFLPYEWYFLEQVRYQPVTFHRQGFFHISSSQSGRGQVYTLLSFRISTSSYGMKLKFGSVIALDKRKQQQGSDNIITLVTCFINNLETRNCFQINARDLVDGDTIQFHVSRGIFNLSFTLISCQEVVKTEGLIFSM